MARSSFVAFAFVVAMLGCEKKAPLARAVVAPTASEAEAMGKQFAAALAPCDAAAIDRIVDINLLFDRAVANRNIGRAELDGIKKGAGSLGGRLCKQLDATTATYLRTQTIESTPRPLVRLLQNAGFNYYQLELDKQSGIVRVADIYVFAAGEKLSESFGRGLDAIRASDVSSALQVTDIATLAQSGDYKGAHAKLLALDPKLRASKPIMMMEITIASELDESLYSASMDNFARAFPDDPALALIQLDNMIMRKQHAEALAVADKLEKQVGGDPYLESMRADPLVGLGKFDEAITRLKKAISQEPTLEQLWWSLLTAQSAAGKYADVVATLDQMKQQLGADVSLDTLALDERFVKLTESAEVQAWAAKQ